MIRAVLFDLDGTLADSILDLANTVNKVLKKYGYEERPLENFNYYVGNGTYMLMKRALPDGTEEETVKKLHKEFSLEYEKHCLDNTKPFEKMPETVSALKNNNIKTAVITNKPYLAAVAVAEKLYGRKTFDVIVGQTKKFPKKPQPHMAFNAMSEMDVNSDECLFVGDSSVDILTADNCGAVSVGVLWGYRTKEELKNAGARFIISEPKEILKIVSEINNV